MEKKKKRKFIKVYFEGEGLTSISLEAIKEGGIILVKKEEKNVEESFLERRKKDEEGAGSR